MSSTNGDERPRRGTTGREVAEQPPPGRKKKAPRGRAGSSITERLGSSVVAALGWHGAPHVPGGFNCRV